VKLELQLSADLPLLRGDPNYLKQLLLNLIINGIQAMPSGGTLTVTAGADNNVVRIAVSDSGAGIDPEALERIFEPYFTTKANGSGLGLAIARRIAEAHGGTITVESERQRGSRFQVVLPRAAAEA
jgi:signal transduction histidine kinase